MPVSRMVDLGSRRTGCDLVPASIIEPDHGAGSADPWIGGLCLRRLSASFHPNLAGMQAVADRVVDLVAPGGA